MDSGVTSNLDANLRRGVAQYCVLAVLSRGERYGADLVRELSEPGGLVASEGTLYPLLSRLASIGWLESSWREDQGRPKKFYSVTPAGRIALRKFLQEWASFVKSVESVLPAHEGTI